MFCEKCGAELEDNQKFCTKCGAKIEDINPPPKRITTKPKKDFKLNKKGKITVITLISLVILSIGGFFAYDIISTNIKNDIFVELPENENISEYKSVKYHTADYADMDCKQILDNLAEQETDLKEFLSQEHKTEENDTLFSVFYYNIIEASKEINKKANTENNSNIIIDKGDRGYINHSSKLLTAVSNCGYETEPNFEYIHDTFSKYLSDSVKEYLTFKKNDQAARSGMPLWVDGSNRNNNISRERLINYLLSLRKMITKNPEIALWQQIVEDIKIYTDAFVYIPNYENETEEDIISAFKKFLRVAKRGTWEYKTIKEFYGNYTKEDEYFGYYDDTYNTWYNERFYDGSPVITQYEINMHSGEINALKEKQFKAKSEEFKKLKLDDNGALGKYIDENKNRENIILDIVFPKRNTDSMEYGSSFPVQLCNVEEGFYKLELYTYQKIADTYKNKYEHTNIIKKQGYHEYYEKVTSRIIASDSFTGTLKNYISGYDTRKAALKQIVSNKMSDIDFDVWFDKLELYSYKSIMLLFDFYTNMSEEADTIFAKE